MSINVIIFGQLADITGSNTLTLADVADTNQLVAQLHAAYPAIAKIPYAIAVNKEVISSNTILNNTTTVALLPPFSGG